MIIWPKRVWKQADNNKWISRTITSADLARRTDVENRIFIKKNDLS